MRIIKTAILILFFSIATNAFAQFGIGIRNSRYAYVDYRFKNHWDAAVDISVFSEKLGFQYAKGSLGYHNSFKNLSYEGNCYYGSAFNRSYYNGGAALCLDYTVIRRLVVSATMNPHYDSGYGYKTCYNAGLGVVITPDINIFGRYTTIPEYRMSEKRAHIGLDFHVKNLNVIPVLSIGTTATESGSKSLRVLMSFNYRF